MNDVFDRIPLVLSSLVYDTRSPRVVEGSLQLSMHFVRFFLFSLF